MIFKEVASANYSLILGKIIGNIIVNNLDRLVQWAILTRYSVETNDLHIATKKTLKYGMKETWHGSSKCVKDLL